LVEFVRYGLLDPRALPENLRPLIPLGRSQRAAGTPLE